MINIAPAQPADMPDVLRMIRALSAFHGDNAQVTLNQLNTIFFGPQAMGSALIAKSGGAAIGYVGLTPSMCIHDGTLRLDIHHLFVCEDHRGTGVGTALIDAAKSHAIASGAVRLTIGTAASNTMAVVAYRAMSDLVEITDAGPRFRINLEP